jgi:L-lysine 2,3-aminomutase
MPTPTASEVSHSADDLVAKIEELNATLVNQVKLLRHVLMRGKILNSSIRARLGSLSLLEL